MRRILFFVTGVLLAAGAMAQSARLDAFRRKLAQKDPSNGARVVITEDDSVRAAVRQSRESDRKIHGYRVRIFFDNGQYARQKASEALSQFRSLYPGIPAYIIYENPYFKVSVGNCVTSEEAVRLWGNVKSSFDHAFVVREDFSISALTEVVNAESVAE